MFSHIIVNDICTPVEKYRQNTLLKNEVHRVNTENKVQCCIAIQHLNHCEMNVFLL